VSPPSFRHPPASRVAAQTGGPSGARERETAGSSLSEPACLNRSPSAPLGPPVSLSLSLGRAKLGPEGSPEDDER